VQFHMLPTPTAKANMLAPSMQKWAAHRNLFPTPTASDANSGSMSEEARAARAAESSRGEKLANEVGGSLNPTFVEFLMGFPRDWTEV
jgi:hypothetical protein